MDKLKEFELQRDSYKRQLKQKTEMLKYVCEKLLDNLENDKLSNINDLGEVQTLGSDVDVLCAKVSLLNEICKCNKENTPPTDRMKELWVKEFLRKNKK